MTFAYSQGLVGVLIALTGATPTPAATLDWQVTAYADGNHNALTDLVRWKGTYYLCFRHATSHMSMDGEIRVMKSADLKTWTPCGALNTLGDDRDPHFCVAGDTLFVYFGVWDLEHQPGDALPDRGKVRSYCASTQDGEHWSKIRGVYEPGFWLWRVRRHDGVFYSAAYTAVRPKPATRETRLLRSTDGLHWTLLSTVTNQRSAGEADLLWRPNGQTWLITRTNDQPGDAEWFRSDAHMMKWTGASTGILVHSPVFATWKDRVFLAGRAHGASGYVTRLWEIIGDKLKDVITLPSGGDNAYPGLVTDPASLDADAPAFFVSWYSQHESDRNNPAEKNTANVYVGHVTVTR